MLRKRDNTAQGWNSRRSVCRAQLNVLYMNLSNINNFKILKKKLN